MPDFILYEKADFWNDNIVSYAVFDLGNQFDYVSFTAGYVGKSWTMTNDVIRVYADDRLILEAPMMATYPNQDFILPIGKCRKLRFENGGSGNHTTYLETASGEVCKAVSIRIDNEERLNDGDYLDISQEYQACLEELQRLRKLDADLAGLGLSYVNAGLGLPELGLGAIAYGRVLKTGRQTVKACIEAVKEMAAEKQAELSMLETWLRTASVIDGISSTRYTLLCPLAPGETPPDDMLQLLVNFDVR